VPFIDPRRLSLSRASISNPTSSSMWI